MSGFDLLSSSSDAKMVQIKRGSGREYVHRETRCASHLNSPCPAGACASTLGIGMRPSVAAAGARAPLQQRSRSQLCSSLVAARRTCAIKTALAPLAPSAS